MVSRVILTRAASKAVQKAPEHIAVKLLGWIDLVENEGLQSARRIPGYRDELLRGPRKGQRSIRLSRAWRAIYVLVEPEAADQESFVEVREVHKHDY